MALFNLGTARGKIAIDSSDLKNADLAIRSAGRGMLIFGAAAIGAFAAIVGEAAKFEKEMDFVQAVTNATKEDMKSMEQAAIDLAKKSIYGPVELSQAMVELAKAGATTEEIINGVLEASVNLAQAADVPVSFAGENLINILNTYEMGAEEAARVTDLLAGAANASSVELEDIVTTMRYAGPVAAVMGISIEDLNTAITALGKVGIKGSTAGTSLRFFMSRLIPTTKDATDAVEELGLHIDETTGAVKEWTDENGNLLEMADIFQTLQDRTKDMTALQKANVIESLFGVRAMPAMLRLLEQGKEGFMELEAEINRTTAADVAAKRMDNLDGAIKNLKATLKAAAVEGASPLLDGLKMIVQTITGFIKLFSDLPQPIKTFIILGIGVIGVLAIIAGLFLLTIGNIVRMVRVIIELRRAFALLNGIMLANPMLLLIAAIILLIGYLVYLYFTNEKFRESINNLWQDAQAAWDGILNGVKQLWQDMQAAWDGILKGASDLWQDIQAGWDGVLDGFKAIPGQIAGFFSDLPGRIGGFFSEIGSAIAGAFSGAARAVGGFFADLGRAIGGFFGDVGRVLGDVGEAIGGFFSRLPGYIARGLVTAARAVGDFIADLVYAIGYGLGWVLGRFIRIFFIEIPRYIYRGLNAARKGIQRFFANFPQWFQTGGGAVLEFLRKWGAQLLVWVGQAFNAFIMGIWWFIQRIPGFFVNVFNRIVDFLWEVGLRIVAAMLWMGEGIYNAIAWLIFSLPDIIWQALQTMWDYITTQAVNLWHAAQDLANGIWDGIQWLYEDLPNIIWDTIWEIGKRLIDGVQLAWDWAYQFGKGLWEGLLAGIGIGGDVQGKVNVGGTAAAGGNALGNAVGRVNSMTNRPVDGLGRVAETRGMGNIPREGFSQLWNQNAPLIGQATIRSENDIVDLARQLERERQRTMRSRGLSTVGSTL